MATRASRSIEESLVLVAEETGLRAGQHPDLPSEDDEAFLAKRVEAAGQEVVRTPTPSELAGLEQTVTDLQRRLDAAQAARTGSRAALADAIGRAGVIGRPAWTGPLTAMLAAVGVGCVVNGGLREWAIVMAAGAVLALNTAVLLPALEVLARSAAVVAGWLHDATFGSVWQWRRAAVARELSVARVRATQAPALRAEFTERMRGLLSATYRVSRSEGALFLAVPATKGPADASA